MLSLKQNDKDLSALELEKVVKDLKGRQKGSYTKISISFIFL